MKIRIHPRIKSTLAACACLMCGILLIQGIRLLMSGKDKAENTSRIHQDTSQSLAISKSDQRLNSSHKENAEPPIHPTADIVKHRTTLASTLKEFISNEQYVELFQYLKNLDDDEMRIRGAKELERLISISTPAQVSEWIFTKLIDQGERAAFEFYYPILRKHHPEAVDVILSRLSDRSNEEETLIFLTSAWSQDDPQAALKWLKSQQNTESENWREAYHLLMITYLKKDPESAIGEFTNLTDVDLQRDMAQAMAASLYELDFFSSLEWASELEDDLSYEYVMTGMFRSYAKDDPSAAFDYLLQWRGENLQKALFDQIVDQLDRLNPPDVLNRIDKIDDLKVKQQVVSSVMKHWLSKAPDEAHLWADTLPKGQMQKHAYSAIAQGLSETNPEAAFKWAIASATSSQDRMHYLLQAGESWFFKDVNRFEAALTAAGVSTEERTSLYNTFSDY